MGLADWLKTVGVYFTSSTLLYLVGTKSDVSGNIKLEQIAEASKRLAFKQKFNVTVHKPSTVTEMFTAICDDIEVERNSPVLITRSGSPSKSRNSSRSAYRSGVFTDRGVEIMIEDGCFTKFPFLISEVSTFRAVEMRILAKQGDEEVDIKSME
jgi:hypothetical protein